MRIAIVCSSKDMTCGIGDYSRSLADALKGKADIIYCNDINENLLDFDPDMVNLQWEYGLYDADTLTRQLNILKRKGIRTSVTLHGWSDYDSKNKIIETMFDQYIVTNPNFEKHIVKRGIDKQIDVIPIGMKEYNFIDDDSILIRDLLGISPDTPVIGAFGFMELYKNYHTIIEALTKGTDHVFLLCSYSKDLSDSYAMELQQMAQNLNVKYIRLGSYMTMSTVVKALNACDVLVYPYVDVFTYSSSAAIRAGISSLTPVIASDITFFEDIPDVSMGGPVYKNKKGLVEAINSVLTDEKLRARMLENSKSFIQQNSWENIAQMYVKAFEY